MSGAYAENTLPRSFYSKRALEVAPLLLGCILVCNSPEGVTAGIISETEAYEGPEDRACHAFNGRRTPRNEVMYGPPGYAYVYFTYGMHYMLNAVTAPEGTPHAVLIRSVIPVAGQAIMRARRLGREPLSQGPGRLTQAMGITGYHNGADLAGNSLFIAFPRGRLHEKPQYDVTSRIGVDYSGEAKDYPWRFILRNMGREA